MHETDVTITEISVFNNITSTVECTICFYAAVDRLRPAVHSRMLKEQCCQAVNSWCLFVTSLRINLATKLNSILSGTDLQISYVFRLQIRNLGHADCQTLCNTMQCDSPTAMSRQATQPSMAWEGGLLPRVQWCGVRSSLFTS